VNKNGKMKSNSTNTKRKMVLAISSSIGGGAQKLLLDITPYFQERFDLLIICPEGYLAQKLVESGFKPIIMDVNIRNMRKMKKIIESWSEGESCVVNSYLFGTSFYACYSFRHTANIKVVSLLLNPIIRDGMSWPKKVCYKFVAQYIGKKSARIVVGSPELEQEVFKFAKKKVFYLENRVPNIVKEKNNFYHGNSGATLKICFAGRMVEQKRPDILVKTARLFKLSGINVKFYMAGEGSLKKEIRNFVDENDLSNTVEFIGFVDNIYDFLGKMDILACTSEFENTPLIILNAMNASLPVVAGNVPGIPHLIHNDDDGLITDEYSPEGFYRAILKIINSTTLCETMGRNAYKKAVTNYSYKEFVNKFYKIVNECFV